MARQYRAAPVMAKTAGGGGVGHILALPPSQHPVLMLCSAPPKGQCRWSEPFQAVSLEEELPGLRNQHRALLKQELQHGVLWDVLSATLLCCEEGSGEAGILSSQNHSQDCHRQTLYMKDASIYENN